MVVNKFSKMSHFVPYNNSNDVSHIADLYFKETEISWHSKNYGVWLRFKIS